MTAARWWIPGLDFPKAIHNGLQPDVRLPDGTTDPAAAIDAARELLFK